MLPDLQAKPEVEVGRLPDGTIAVRANVIADDPVVAYCQSAAGKVLKCDSRVRHSHGGPARSRRDLLVAALGETGAGYLSAARAARLGDAGVGCQSGREEEQDGKEGLHCETSGVRLSNDSDR